MVQCTPIDQIFARIKIRAQGLSFQPIPLVCIAFSLRTNENVGIILGRYAFKTWKSCIMKKMCAIVIFCLPVMLLAQDKKLGLGIILGEPTGLTGKYWMTGTTAIDMAAAWSFGKNDALQLQADYVLHKFNMIDVERGRLPFYFGIGGHIVLGDKTGLGVRIPVGLDYLFARDPLDVFIELVPGIQLAPSTDFNLDGGIGIRYWF